MINAANRTMIIFCAVFACILFGACSQNNSPQNNGYNDINSVIPAVEAVQAQYGSLPLVERLSGTVVAKNQVELYPEISGRIEEVLVNDGEKVKKNDPLVRLDDNQFREQVQQAEAGYRINNARLKQAEAQLHELQARYKRMKTLAERELSSALEMETLEAQMESARADVELAKAQLEQAEATLQEQKEILSKTVIRAPISGTIGQRNAEVGMGVGSDTHLFTIGNLGDLRIEVVLTEEMLSYILLGQTAEIFVPSQNEQEVLRAELSRLSPFLNPVTRSTEAEIDIKNEDGLLRPGMFVAVDILYGESQRSTLLPTSALYTDPRTGEEGVYVATTLGTEVEPVREDTNSQNPPPLTEPVEVRFKPINVIARGRMELGVTGIDPGDWVVTVGQHLLSGGRQRARVRTSSWERILALQGLQRQDLLKNVLEFQNKQDTVSLQPTM